MIDFSLIGNIELLNMFLSLHYLKYKMFAYDLKNDPLAHYHLEKLKEYFSENGIPLDVDYYYLEFLNEAIKRGLKVDENNLNKHFIYEDAFDNWSVAQKNNPTFVREIFPKDIWGDMDISYVADEAIGFDFPVREACKILYDKGYVTYWSSGNYNDIRFRKSAIVLDKSVAYILIDPANLSKETKEKLLLNGTCKLWGLALNHADNGKYYGIWAEIKDDSVTVEEISNVLKNIALSLPNLMVEVDSEIKIK